MKISIATQSQLAERSMAMTVDVLEKTLRDFFEVCMALPAALGEKFTASIEVVRVVFWAGANLTYTPEVIVVWVDPNGVKHEAKQPLAHTLPASTTVAARVKMVCEAVKVSHQQAVTHLKWEKEKLMEAAPL